MPSLRIATPPSRRLVRGAVALALGLAAVQAGAAEPVALSIKRLGVETALRAARTALDTCRARGMQVAVTVVDRDGLTQVALRDVLAPELALRISALKAATAASFAAPTSSLASTAGALAHVPGVLFSAGAVPISAGGTLYGAIGVSGSHGGDVDEACAAAGAAAIEPDLEMQ